MTGRETARLRPLVEESWFRSSAAGIKASRQSADLVLDDSTLVDYRGEHALARVLPVLEDLVGRAAADSGCMVAVTDANGVVLWTVGAASALRRAEAVQFVPGSAWDEAHAGTNAPGTALYLDRPVQIQGGEHYAEVARAWSCTAVPIHWPRDGSLLGALDLSGGHEAVSSQALGLVRSAARVAELELARLAAWSTPVAAEGEASERVSSSRIEVRGLGRRRCLAVVDGRSIELSHRHSEIVAVLAEAPQGMTADELEVEIYASGVHSATVRSEVNRLRRLLGPSRLASRPYRLVGPVATDWSAVSAHLATGRLLDAMRLYQGPLLPWSGAPGVERRRGLLHRQLRTALLSSGRVDLMLKWTRSNWGAMDLQMWEKQSDSLPADSPLKPQVEAETDHLHQELGPS